MMLLISFAAGSKKCIQIENDDIKAIFSTWMSFSKWICCGIRLIRVVFYGTAASKNKANEFLEWRIFFCEPVLYFKQFHRKLRPNTTNCCVYPLVDAYVSSSFFHSMTIQQVQPIYLRKTKIKHLMNRHNHDSDCLNKTSIFIFGKYVQIWSS